MAREMVKTSAAPAAVGPYSQAIAADGWVYCSGQIPLDPKTGQLVEGGIEPQARRVLDNLQAVLEAAGCRLSDVIKTTIYMTDLGAFGQVNAIYGEYFGESLPARVTVGIAALPKGAAIEIDALAKKGA